MSTVKQKMSGSGRKNSAGKEGRGVLKIVPTAPTCPATPWRAMDRPAHVLDLIRRAGRPDPGRHHRQDAAVPQHRGRPAGHAAGGGWISTGQTTSAARGVRRATFTFRADQGALLDRRRRCHRGPHRSHRSARSHRTRPATPSTSPSDRKRGCGSVDELFDELLGRRASQRISSAASVSHCPDQWTSPARPWSAHPS